MTLALVVKGRKFDQVRCDSCGVQFNVKRDSVLKRCIWCKAASGG